MQSPITAAKPTFFTIGYQHHTVESLIQALGKNGVQVLVDVRQNPCSRKSGFSKRHFEGSVQRAGIAYMHAPNLGTPPKIRDVYRTSGDVKKALAESEAYLSLNAGLMEPLAKMAATRRICLLCLERDHNLCHRGIIARKLCDMTRWNSVHLT